MYLHMVNIIVGFLSGNIKVFCFCSLKVFLCFVYVRHLPSVFPSNLHLQSSRFIISIPAFNFYFHVSGIGGAVSDPINENFRSCSIHTDHTTFKKSQISHLVFCPDETLVHALFSYLYLLVRFAGNPIHFAILH